MFSTVPQAVAASDKIDTMVAFLMNRIIFPFPELRFWLTARQLLI
jgi:hypothetical protein